MKTVVVTGANRGLGLAITNRLLEDGYSIVGVARSITPEIESLQARVNNDSVQRLSFISFDLSKTSEIYGLSQQILANNRSIYGLINNAALGLDGLLATQHESDISLMLNVNLLSTILLTKYLSRAMLIKREGRIVNISSIIASTGFSGLSVYGATKAALIGFSKSLSREIGKAGITVNCVCPGYMETAMTAGLNAAKLDSIRRRSPFGKFTNAADVAGAVSYLLTPDANMITGTSITVDAGSTA